MKVLLNQDVKGAGRAGDIVDVNDGYARNYLIPKGLAFAADANSINAARIKKSALDHRKAVQRQKLRDLASGMSGLKVTVKAKAGDNGKLFGSITAKEIADALKEQHGVDVEKKKIQLDEPIKTLGLVDVKAHLQEDAIATFQVEVVAL